MSDTSAAMWQSSFEMALMSDGMEDLSLGFVFESLQDAPGQFISSILSDDDQALTFAKDAATEYLPSTSTTLSSVKT